LGPILATAIRFWLLLLFEGYYPLIKWACIVLFVVVLAAEKFSGV